MNERIRLLRSELGLSQVKFAEQLNVSQNFIAMVETAKRGVSDRTISDICRIWNVSENWLRTGDGSMFEPMTIADEINAFMGDLQKVPPDDPRWRIMRMLAKLPVTDWEAVAHMIELLNEDHQSQ